MLSGREWSGENRDIEKFQFFFLNAPLIFFYVSKSYWEIKTKFTSISHSEKKMTKKLFGHIVSTITVSKILWILHLTYRIYIFRYLVSPVTLTIS